jgi:hypothetical protein
MSGEIRSAEPLTPRQLEALVDVASDMGFRYRLIVEVIPYTGLTLSEFCHFREDWCRYTDIDSDAFNISVPLGSPCAGTLRTEQSGRQLEVIERPCWLCQNEGEWRAAGKSRSRMIPVLEEATRDILNLCFEQYGMDSLPFTVSSNFYHWMDELSAKAGLSREFGFRALRRSFGTTLIRKGFNSEEVAKYLGLSTRYKTKSLYDAVSEPIDWSTRTTRSLSDAEVIEALQRLTARLDRRPMTDDIENHFEYSFKAIYNHFGGLHAALDAAGIDVPERHPQAIPREELLAELRRLAEQLGHPPLSSEIEEHGQYSKSVFFTHFESWDAVIEASGLDSEDLPNECDRQIGREALLRELQRLAEELGKPPRRLDLKKKGRFSYQPYYTMFGGIHKAREAAGVSHPSSSRQNE